ncbi:hypothetical protein C0J52_01100 [Blattella germanica]|nr:hypothetical protein C0J52_01100 [Blattella germanica]
MFGVWKRRFPAMRMKLCINIHTALRVIIATAVLHNLAIQMRDANPPEELMLHQYLAQRRVRLRPVNEEDVPVLVPHLDVQTAVGFRNAVAETHFR